jgi:hypothetical protein
MLCFKEAVAILLIMYATCAASDQLFTNKAHIVSESSGQRVHLKCVNWYGAHQELFAVGGLERVSIRSIVHQIVSMGSNCVRVPFSIELWKRNPTPSVGEAVAVECGRNVSAMVLLDCVIRGITNMGVMVILNNHNSFAGWVGNGDQGLWHLPNYPVSDWLYTLEHMAARFANNSLVVGMDIRNEIHDMNGVLLTWAKTDDITSDWSAASSLAAERIERVNPKMLVIVSGLCLGYDLSEMMDKPGPVSALRRRKLVYTTHVYPWVFWWTRIPWFWLEVSAYTLLLLGVITAVVQFMSLEFGTLDPVEVVLYLVSAFGPFALAWGFLNVYLLGEVKSIGCNAMAQGFNPAIILWFCTAVMSVLCTIYLGLRKTTHAWLLVFAMLCCLHAVFLIFVSASRQSYAMVELELSRWRLDTSPVPIWVGEFGSAWNDNSLVWKHLLRFIRTHELDFAYWPLNGLKWEQSKQQWTDESFGLLDQNYTKLRNAGLVAAIFA